MLEELDDNLMENSYVLGEKANYDWLMESKAQLEKGKIIIHELTEDIDRDVNVDELNKVYFCRR